MNTQDNLHYCGSFSTLNTGSKETAMNYGPTTLSEKQNELYCRALVGLSAYPKEELVTMHPKKKSRIQRIHRRAQKELNRFKQQRTRELLEKQIGDIIPNLREDSLLAQLLSTEVTSNKHRNKLPLKDLDIKKSDIIKLWVENKILPSNFATL